VVNDIGRIDMNARELPPVHYLAKFISYDPDTGVITRLQDRRSDLLGPVRSKCYNISIENVKYLKRRVVWKLQTGKEPPHKIAHLDGDEQNFRWDNLGAWYHPKRGDGDAYFVPARGTWMVFGAYDRRTGRSTYLGITRSREEAEQLLEDYRKD